jgi:sugar/nucleoside kinase (ribokinase family)
VGNDDFGKRLVNHLKDLGVDAENVRTDPKRSHRTAFQAEECFGIFEADATNEIAKKPLIHRDLATFHVHAN